MDEYSNRKLQMVEVNESESSFEINYSIFTSRLVYTSSYVRQRNKLQTGVQSKASNPETVEVKWESKSGREIVLEHLPKQNGVR